MSQLQRAKNEEAIATKVEAIASSLEAIATVATRVRPSLLDMICRCY